MKSRTMIALSQTLMVRKRVSRIIMLDMPAEANIIAMVLECVMIMHTSNLISFTMVSIFQFCMNVWCWNYL